MYMIKIIMKIKLLESLKISLCLQFKMRPIVIDVICCVQTSVL